MVTGPPYLPCSVDGCTQWFHNLSGLKKHVRLQHQSQEFLDPGPHLSPRYHNPTSSPPPRTPPIIDTRSSSPHSLYRHPFDDCGYHLDDEEDEPIDSDGDLSSEGPRTPSPMDTHSSSPRSLYRHPFDDCGYHLDDKEDEPIDSDGDLDGEGIPYYDGNDNESNPAPTRNFHDLLNGAQSNHHFTFFSNKS